MSKPTGRAPADYDTLPAGEQAAIRAEWAQEIARRLVALNLEAEFAAAGAAYSEVDECGRARRRQPRVS